LGAHIVFADESGFQLIPNVIQTWASQRQTPIHRHRQGRRDKISVISGISVSSRRRGYKWAQLARNRESRARELKMLRIIALESQGRGVKRSQAPIRAFLQGFERMRIVTPHMSVSG
jgi:hypothetical protein